jgi:hypothetical protein
MACEIFPTTVLESWTEQGWTRVHRVIRHALPPGKRVVRVETTAGLVDVTDDHSLLRPDGSPVSPKDLRVGDALMRSPCPADFSQDAADIPYGVPRIYVAPSSIRLLGGKTTASVHESEPPVMDATACQVEYKHAWICSRAQLAAAITLTLGERAGLDVVASSMSMSSTPAGTCKARAGGLNIPGVRIVTSTDLSDGSNVSNAFDASNASNTSESEDDAEDDGDADRPAVVTRIHVLDGFPKGEFVYDLTTENHHFAAGVGQLVVHNTDSIFIVFRNVDPVDGVTKLVDKAALASSIAQGQAASKGIAPRLPPPHNLEYEKTMFPLILLSKKRYVGLLFEDDAHATPKLKSMGIALKRRDYAPIVKTIYGGVLDILLKDRDIPRAAQFLADALDKLAGGNVALSELIISKTLAASYKQPHHIAHWVLARRMYERDPGSAPQANDRVPYVFIETDKPHPLMGDRIEHVDYVRDHLAGGCFLDPSPRVSPRATKNAESDKAGKGGSGSGSGSGSKDNKGVRVDTKTYIENQIMKPCVQLLSIALEQLPGYATKADLTGPKAFQTIVTAKDGNEKKARERLDTLREREVQRLLFDPVLAMGVFRQRDNRCKNQHEITTFFNRVARKKEVAVATATPGASVEDVSEPLASTKDIVLGSGSPVASAASAPSGAATRTRTRTRACKTPAPSVQDPGAGTAGGAGAAPSMTSSRRKPKTAVEWASLAAEQASASAGSP